MRLTTKFSAFITLLTGLTIFVTLIGCSLSFYNAVQYKYVSRVQATATAIDTHLVTHDIVSLTPQIDELMIASDIVRVDLLQGGAQRLQPFSRQRLSASRHQRHVSRAGRTADKTSRNVATSGLSGPDG
ncbi:lipoprotein [Salmonella enterica subsp. enterica]|nr:lipoprotein [Salmonella enterica subsp. enterica] [Salmonella enterica subsp. enterica serovar Menston]